MKEADELKKANELVDCMKSILTEMDANITDLLRSLRRRKRKKTKKRDADTHEETLVDHSSLNAEDAALEEEMENLGLDDDCSVCFRDLTDGGVVELTCHHKFHDQCVDDWIVTCRQKRLPPTCPICRGHLMI